MKREISIGTFGGPSAIATIAIDKNGLRVESKNPYYESDDYFIRNFLANCVNMDEWQHTWHMDISKAKYKFYGERKEVRKILLEKIEQRIQEIQKLKDAIQILGRWH